jgi:hypothetical protein
MSDLIRLVPTILLVSAADLLLFFYWYHLGNAQTRFLLYDEFLAQANGRFIASGFVAGSLVLVGGLGIGLVYLGVGRRSPRRSWLPACCSSPRARTSTPRSGRP